MRKLFLQLAAVVLVLSACQKEKSLEDPNATPGNGGGGGGTIGNRLVRTGTRLGTDSVTIDYSYNAANFLTGISFSGTFQGLPLALQQTIKRDASNLITSVVLKSPLLLAEGYNRDTLATQLFYDAVTGRYIRSMSRFVLDNESYTDSTVYSYNAVGKLSSSIVYFNDGGTSDYFPYFKKDYSFAENNLVETKLSIFNGTTFDLEDITTLNHDSKVNPLPLAAEAPFLVLSNLYSYPLHLWFYTGLNNFYSVNNVSNIKVDNVSTSDVQEAAITYTYNSRNLPETCTRTIGGVPFSVTSFFYQ